MNSAMGERQMLPWQMNNTRIIYFKLLIYLGFSLFFKHSRTFSVCRPFFHISAYFGLSRHVYSIKWSKDWSKMGSDFKFRPSAFLLTFAVQQWLIFSKSHCIY
jgi:hypothetical protein